MHILIIPSWYPQNSCDISGIFFREQAIALKKRGHKSGVLVPQICSLRDLKKKPKVFGLKKENDMGVFTYRFRSVNVTPKLSGLVRHHWLALGKKLFKEYVKDHGFPDIVHVHSMDRGVFLANDLYDEYQLPYLVTEHSSAFARGVIDKKLLKKLLRPAKNAASRIAVSQVFAKLLESKLPGTKWDYIPNIVSQKFIDYEIRQPESDEFIFLNACFLTENKCVDNLLKAFSLLCHDYDNVRLKIVGDGTSRKKLEQLAIDLGIKENVAFCGMLKRKQVVVEMSKANAFVLSSEYETFGVVLVEALALGKPVVATRCGGPESIVNDNVGYLVDKNNVNALYEGMKKLYRTEYNSFDIKRYCIDNFSENAVIGQLEKVYLTMLAKPEKVAQVE